MLFLKKERKKRKYFWSESIPRPDYDIKFTEKRSYVLYILENHSTLPTLDRYFCENLKNIIIVYNSVYSADHA